MTLVGYILIGSVFVLPAAALLALRWAGREGQFAHADRAALLPFDESEPVGVMTDAVLNTPRSTSPTNPSGPETQKSPA